MFRIDVLHLVCLSPGALHAHLSKCVGLGYDFEVGGDGVLRMVEGDFAGAVAQQGADQGDGVLFTAYKTVFSVVPAHGVCRLFLHVNEGVAYGRAVLVHDFSSYMHMLLGHDSRVAYHEGEYCQGEYRVSHTYSLTRKTPFYFVSAPKKRVLSRFVRAVGLPAKFF